MPITTIVIIASSLMFIPIYYILAKKKETQSEYTYVNKKKDFVSIKRNFLYQFTQILKKNSLTKKRYNRIHRKIQTIYPMESVIVDIMATEKILKEYLIAIVAILCVLIMGRRDLFFIMAGLMLIYLLLDYVTNTATEKMEDLLLVQMRTFVTDIIDNYNKLQTDPADAVRVTLDKNPPEIGVHADLIYRALISVNIREASREYTDKAPNNYLMLLMAICQSVQEFGDKRIGHNESMFVKNLTYLNDEVSRGITLRQDNARRFKSQTLLCVIPVVFIKPMQWWNEGNFPETETYFNGLVGSIMMMLMFVMIILGYMMISSLKSGKDITIREHSIFLTIAQFPPIARFCRAYNRKHYTKAQRINDDLLMVRDRTGVNAFYVKKTAMALGVILAISILLGASVLRERAAQFDFTDAYKDSFSVSATYEKSMEDVSETVAETYKNVPTEKLSEEQITTALQKNKINNKTYAQAMARLIYAKCVEYHNMYYQWWYLVISIAVGIAAFFVPDLMLKFQVDQAMKDQIDEIARFQTLALILMNVDAMTLEQVLEWMDKFSFCFKYRIEECMLDMPEGEKKALEKMQEGPSKEFNSFVDNLLNIDNVGIVQAFASIEGDREFFQTLRDSEQKERSETNARTGSMIAFASVMMVIIVQMILPMAMTVTTMQNSLNNALTGMAGG